MSLNTAHANGGVLIYNGEIILLYCDGVEMIIEGSNAKDFGGTKKGKIYLTTHRMIFMNKSEKDPVQSFSFPFFSMTALELEQPVFGANYIKGLVHAQAGGNWTGKATFKLKFFSGGAIEFGQAMLRAAKMASQNMPPQPPAYTPHQGPYYPAAPPAYMPPSGGVNGFVPPTHVFPDAPPANSVYTMDMPPPYPGIYPPPYAYPPGSQNYPQAGPQGPIGYPGNVAPPGFNVQNGGAAAPPGAYPAAPGAYPPAPGAYPASGAYPPASGAYPPASGAYPPASGAYPPASGAYPSAPGAYPPAPGAYPPTSGAYPSNTGVYPSAPSGNPPPYNPQQQPGSTAQHSGVMQQPPYNESKAGVPPIYDFYQDPYNPQMMYTQQHMNGHAQNSQGPPPPYSEASKKDQ